MRAARSLPCFHQLALQPIEQRVETVDGIRPAITPTHQSRDSDVIGRRFVRQVDVVAGIVFGVVRLAGTFGAVELAA